MSCEDCLFFFSRKLKAKVSEPHPCLSSFLPVSVEPQPLTLLLQIKPFVLLLLPTHTVLLVSSRTSNYCRLFRTLLFISVLIKIPVSFLIYAYLSYNRKVSLFNVFILTVMVNLSARTE